MSIELRPCPFCGNGAIAASYVADMFGMRVTRVECSHCWAELSDDTDAAAAWNTRAERTCRMLPGRPYYDMGEEGYTCSECGSWAKLDWVAHYCPNCGAKVVE